MDEFLNKLNINLPKLKRFINKSTAYELSQLSTPCYYPKTKKLYYELLALVGIKDKEFKEFVKNTYKNTKAAQWALWKDPTTNLLIVIMHIFLKNRDVKMFMSTMVYYMIVQYSRLMNKQIKYCYEDTFSYTLDNMTRTHLFYREKTISNSLFYLANEVQKRFKDDIKDWDIEKIISFIGISRHRISQSVKSFAESYYRYRKEGMSIKTQNEPTDDEVNVYQYKVQQRGQKLITELLKKITVYRTIDRKSFDEAKDLTKVKTSVATLMIEKLNNEKNMENIKIIMQLFLKEVTDVSMICGKNYLPTVKRLMTVKRTTAKVYFKAQVNILVKDIIEDMDFRETYEKYTSQTQFIINSFLAFYLTGMIKNSIC